MAEFKLPTFDIIPEGQSKAVQNTPSPQDTPDFGAIQRAIFVHEGGREARTPYGYRPREDNLFGGPAWNNVPAYDRAVANEIQLEWRKYQQALYSNRWPSNTPPGSDFIKWLARHGYNANYKEWDGWEAGVRRQLGQREGRVTGPDGGTFTLPRFSIDIAPQNAPQAPSKGPGTVSTRPDVKGVRRDRISGLQPSTAPTPLARYSQKSGILPAVARGARNISEWIARNEPPALTKYLDKQVTKAGEPLSVIPYIMSGMPVRFNFEKGEYEDPRTGDSIEPMRRADVLLNIAVGSMDFSPGRVTSGARPVARAAAAAEAAPLALPARTATTPPALSIPRYIRANVTEPKGQLALPAKAGPSAPARPMPAPIAPGPESYFIPLPKRQTPLALPPGQYPRTPQPPPPMVFSRMVMQDVANLQVPGGRSMVRSLDTGTLTGEILRPGERGFSELAGMSLDDRLATVMADGTAFARRIEPAVDIPTAPIVATGAAPADRWSQLRMFLQKESGAMKLRMFEEAKQSLAKIILSGVNMEGSWIGQVSKVGKGVARGFLATSDAVMERSGPIGKQLVKMVQNVYNEAEVYAAEPISAFLKLSKGVGKEGWARVRAFREGADIQLSAQEKALYNAITGFLDSPTLKATAERLGIPVPEWEPNYWPRSINWEKLGYIDVKDMFVKKIMEKSPNMSKTTAEKIWTKYVTNRKYGKPFGNLERPREVEYLPYELRMSAEDEIRRYVLGVAKRFAEVKHYGGLHNEEAIRLLSQLPDEYQDFGNKWFSLSTGVNPWQDLAQAGIVRYVSNIEAAAKLNLSFISNFTQPFNNLLVTSVKSFSKALLDLNDAARRAGAADFAEKAGVIHTQTLKELAALGEAVETQIKWARPPAQAFTVVERGNRIFTANVGKYWHEDLIKGLQSGNKWAARDLERIGFNPEAIARLAKGAGTEDDTIKTARWLVEKTQFLNRPGDVPLNWSNPWLRLLFLYKRFTLRQGILMIDAMKEAAKRGNPRPLIIAGAAMPAVGEIIGDVRGMIHQLATQPISTVKDPVQAWREIQGRKPQINWDAWDGNKIDFVSSLFSRWMYGMSWIGGLGIGGDVVRSLAASPGSAGGAVASFIGGPVASDIYGIGIGTIGTFGDIGKAVRRLGMSEEEKAEEKPLEWAGVRGFGRATSGALPYGQFIRNLDIWKTPTARKRMLRTMYFDAIEKGDNDMAQAALQQLNAMGVEITARDEKAVLTRRSKKKRR